MRAVKIHVLTVVITVIVAVAMVFGVENMIPASSYAYAAASLNKTKTTIYAGNTRQLKVRDTKKKVKWSSTNTAVAKVSKKGKVTAIKAGEAKIKAKVGKRTLYCKVTVKCKKHNYRKAEVVQPLKTARGYTLYVCEDCGKTKKGNITYYNPTEEQVYNDIMAMQAEYPEGMKWDGNDHYSWCPDHSDWVGGYGCVGFAMMLSDAGFGKFNPVREHRDFDNIKVGDIIMMADIGHVATILTVDGDYLYVAEGNRGKKIHWTGVYLLSYHIDDPETCILTRYPE